MDVKEFERLKVLISKMELDDAKTQGAIDSIKSSWKKDYGTDDVFEIRKIVSDLETRKNELNEKLDSLYNKLVNSCDWDEIERKLYG